MSAPSLVFHEVYGPVPGFLLVAFKRHNVSQSDWDMMLARWGYQWGDESIPFTDVHRHVVTHSPNGYYSYPLYG